MTGLKEKFIPEEKERFPEYKYLKKLFGENFNPKKTIELKVDLDEHNQPRELGNYQARWTELKNPDTQETVEGKVYFPRGVKDFKKVLIFEPGYRGDSVLQEAKYADALVRDQRAMIVLRHNNLKIKDEIVKDYIHCPEKVAQAEKTKQEYLGPGNDFSLVQAHREVLTAIKSLSDQKIDQIDILGHSWGGRMALMSLMDLQEEAGGTGEQAERAKKLAGKIKNLVLLGAWLETEEKRIKLFQEFFDREEEVGCFKNIRSKEMMAGTIQSGQRLKELTPDKLPTNMRVVGIHSAADEKVNLRGVAIPFFKKQLKLAQRKGFVVLKDLKELSPPTIGGRTTEVHDYAISAVREFIAQIIE
ncbi:hypothetical protein IID20_04060 [Patescibacteria group bacterium]|nr:hypothetical protein [Patescibacteria group bacterium]